VKKRTSIFWVNQSVLKPEKMGEYAAYLKKYEAWTQGQPELFKEVKSVKLFNQVIGSSVGSYLELWEFESLADMERWLGKYSLNKEAAVWHQQWMAMIVPETWSSSIWTLQGQFKSS